MAEKAPGFDRINRARVSNMEYVKARPMRGRARSSCGGAVLPVTAIRSRDGALAWLSSCARHLADATIPRLAPRPVATTAGQGLWSPDALRGLMTSGDG
jgi:hypothetical protein